jgi:hypothetical protein
MYASYEPVKTGNACYTTTNPHYIGAPARMMDGRIMTDYRPRCMSYSSVAAQEMGENVSRKFLMDNAEDLISTGRRLTDKKNTAVNCVDTMVPELYKRVCTYNGCKTIPGNPIGIGTGRIYVPNATNAGPQELSDITIPKMFMTYTRDAPHKAAECATDDAERAWNYTANIIQFGQSAKSHPYSAPRA